MSYWNKQTASRLGRSIVTNVATAQVNATVFTTPSRQSDQTSACCKHARPMGNDWLDGGCYG